MDYIEVEKEFFSQFVVGGEESFNDYVDHKRQDGVWGDDLEIQAMSEIFNKPIEIYAYRNEPMRTFHESEFEGGNPMRVSYHGKCHYNSIILIDGGKQEAGMEPGWQEDEAISSALERKARNLRRHS